MLPPAAAIYVHGARGHIAPEWSSRTQMYLREGIHYIAVNFRGSSGYGKAFSEAGDTRTRTLDVLAAVQYAHKTLGVPYERIAVFGHSDGAGLVAAAARQEPDHIAIAGLVSFFFLDKSVQEIPFHGCPHRIVLLHSTYDYISLDDARGLLAKALGPTATSDAVLRTIEVKDQHNLFVPTSWPAFSEILMEELKRTTSPALAPPSSTTGGATR